MKPAAAFVLILMLAGMTGGPACSADPPAYSGFLGDKSVYDRLSPGPEDGLKMRWASPTLDPKKYNRFIIDTIVLFLADKAQYKGIDPHEMNDLANAFYKGLVAAFKDKYPIVTDPAPDTARIRIAITNIEPSQPARSVVTSIIPVGLGISLVKKGATGGWTGSGSTGMEILVTDSVTNEPIAMGVDLQKAGFESRFTKWGSARDAMKFWSERLVQLIDMVHAGTLDLQK